MRLEELSTSVLRNVTGLKKSEVRKSILEKESSEEDEVIRFENEEAKVK